jgi:hypothetical protein
MVGDAGLVQDAPGSGHPVVVVNDTREAVSGMLIIRDADADRVVFSTPFKVGKNGKLIACYLPKPGKTTLWIIEWEIDEEVQSNHYLAYEPVISLEQYMQWSKTVLND